MRHGGAARGALACAAGLSIAACGHSSVVATRFAAEYDCHDADVQNIGGTTYVARGCGASATYTCAANRGDSVCVRENPVPQRDGPMRRADTAGTRERDERASGEVERRYDEERKLHLVRADFDLGRGMRITLVGAPEAGLGEIVVQVRSPAYALRDLKCGTLEVLINGVPQSGNEFASTEKARQVSIQAHFQFEQFKPLAHKYPAFGARLCAQKLELSDAAVAQLQKFLVIYSEMATEVQRRQAPQPVQAVDAGVQAATTPVAL